MSHTVSDVSGSKKSGSVRVRVLIFFFGFGSNLAFFFRVRFGSGFICRVSGFHKFIFLSKNNLIFGLKNRWKMFFPPKAQFFFQNCVVFIKKNPSSKFSQSFKNE